MIKLSTKSLREFQKRISGIEPYNTLPITKNLRVTIQGNLCTVTKNSINAICIGQIEYEGNDSDILVNEKVLLALLSVTKDEWVEIHDKYLKSAADKIPITFEDITHFPNPPDITDQPSYKLTKDHISAVNIAKSYISDLDNQQQYQFVHLNEDAIYAFHSHYFYVNNSFKDLPSVQLTKEECNIITSQDEIDFLDLPNHHVFFIPGYTYIFTKPEEVKITINGVVSKLQLPAKEFSCSKSEISEFISLANSVSESQITTCTFKGNLLSMNDASYNRGSERVINMTGEADEFVFNSRLILQPFKAIPYTTIKGKVNMNNFILSGGSDQEWFCFLGMSK